MKPPRVYTRGILPFFGGIRRSTLLRLPRGVRFSLGDARLDRGEYSTGRAELRRVRPAHSSIGLRPWSSAKAEKYGSKAREILDEPLEKYADHGTAQFAIPNVLKVPPISEHGNVIEIAPHFGGSEKLSEAVNELQTRLYAA